MASHTPKNLTKSFTFFALVSKMGEIKKIKTNNYTIRVY